MEDKQALRDRVEAAYAAFSGAEQAALSALVCTNLEALPEFREAETILFYYPMADEINLLDAARFSLEQGKRVAFPVCHTYCHMISAHQITGLDHDFVSGSYGIREPRPGCPEVPAAEIDCTITPGRAFDRRGNRIGRGAGYYDRFFDASAGIRVAPAFSFQVFDAVPSNADDVPVDIIVTEDTVIRCSG